MDSMDVEWCEGVSRCGEDEMGRLSSLLVCVRGLSSSSVASDVCDAVVGVLDCLERCGSVVLQSVAVLSGTAGDAAGDRADVLRVLESLRGLSDARLDAVCSDEAAAYDAVVGHLSGLESCVGTEIVSSCMALFTLGCRNGLGLALCCRVDVIETLCDTFTGWFEHLSSGADACEYETGAASSALFGLCGWECGPKLPPESRRPFEQAFKVAFGQVHAASGKTLIEERVCDVFISSMKAGMLSHDDTSLACGWSSAHLNLGYMHPGALPAANESGVFSAALALYRRVEPSPLGGDWWLSTCDVVDVTSTRLFGLWALFALVKRLPSAMQSSWWSELLDHAIRMCKVNASARLSERETMCCTPFVQTLGIVEMAARDESQHEMLAASGVADALDYAILHDFTYVGLSIAAYAAGAAVALVGRNEGGKVLRREAVRAVLEHVQVNVEAGAIASTAPASSVMSHLARVPIMVVSDANKKHMLEYEPLIDMLLECLVINDDNRCKGQDGADAMQEASAGVLHELSLYGPGALALRSHGAAVSTLHKLCEVGTKVSKERGAAALFEIEEDKRPKAVAAVSDDGDDGAGTGLLTGQKRKPPPHVMASYNWDHQDVILRVVASLQDRGYLVWVDTEQMKGATVDTMALAVEGSEVVLIGVSRAYKESSNCRMEAQYALQKKKPLIPLMLTHGYEADG